MAETFTEHQIANPPEADQEIGQLDPGSSSFRDLLGYSEIVEYVSQSTTAMTQQWKINDRRLYEEHADDRATLLVKRFDYVNELISHSQSLAKEVAAGQELGKSVLSNLGESSERYDRASKVIGDLETASKIVDASQEESLHFPMLRICNGNVINKNRLETVCAITKYSKQRKFAEEPM